MRLDKFLSEMNIDSRSNLKKAIRKGNVKVNGTVVTDPGTAVQETDAVTFFGTPVVFESFQYYMLNKPEHVLTATEDSRQKTVMDLMSGDRRRDLFPVGRLDRDTTGLLLITNNGDLAHRLLAPKSHVDKVYEALIKGHVTEQHCAQFRNGIRISEDFTASPAELQILSKGSSEETLSIRGEDGRDHVLSPGDPVSHVRVTIHEGKFHEIKRMFQAIGMQVFRLKRTAMGSLTLDPELRPGDFRRLTEKEVEGLFTDVR